MNGFSGKASDNYIANGFFDTAFDKALDDYAIAREKARESCCLFAKTALSIIEREISGMLRKDEPRYPNEFVPVEFCGAAPGSVGWGSCLGIHAVQLLDLVNAMQMPETMKSAEDFIRHHIRHKLEGYEGIAARIDGISFDAEKFMEDADYRNDPVIRGYSMGLETNDSALKKIYSSLPWTENPALATAFMRGHSARSIYHSMPQTPHGIALFVEKITRRVYFYYSYRMIQSDTDLDYQMRCLFDYETQRDASPEGAARLFWDHMPARNAATVS